jgi:hypothetical protein
LHYRPTGGFAGGSNSAESRSGWVGIVAQQLEIEMEEEQLGSEKAHSVDEVVECRIPPMGCPSNEGQSPCRSDQVGGLPSDHGC